VEDLLLAILQFAIEVLGQVLISVPFDCACRIRRKPEDQPVVFAILFLVVGTIVGVISLAFIPPLIPGPGLRIASLLISPFLAGALGRYIALWQSRTRNPLLVPSYHFWYAFCFTLGLAALRFAGEHAARS